MQANLFGIEFSAIDTLEAKTRIILALKQKMQSLYFINAHCANVAQENAEYRDALHQTNLLLPDGVGIELGCKFTYQSVQQNLNGTDLFPHICQICEITSSRILLIGGEP